MKLQKGVLSVEYHKERERKSALKYRLVRRTDEVIRAIKAHKSHTDISLLDIGTADGLCEELNTSIVILSDPRIY